jgi:hypothetical protein
LGHQPEITILTPEDELLMHRILTAPVDTDEDYRRLGQMVEDRDQDSDDNAEPFGI